MNKPTTIHLNIQNSILFVELKISFVYITRVWKSQLVIMHISIGFKHLFCLIARVVVLSNLFEHYEQIRYAYGCRKILSFKVYDKRSNIKTIGKN